MILFFVKHPAADYFSLLQLIGLASQHERDTHTLLYTQNHK